MNHQHDINPLLSLYQRVEAATTRKEVKAILSEAEQLQKRSPQHEGNQHLPVQH